MDVSRRTPARSRPTARLRRRAARTRSRRPSTAERWRAARSVFVAELRRRHRSADRPGSRGRRHAAPARARCPAARRQRCCPTSTSPTATGSAALVVAWIDALGPVIGSPRSPPSLGPDPPGRAPGPRALHEALAGCGLPRPAAVDGRPGRRDPGARSPPAPGCWSSSPRTLPSPQTRPRRPELARAVAWETRASVPPDLDHRPDHRGSRSAGRRPTSPAAWWSWSAPCSWGGSSRSRPGGGRRSPLDRFDPLRWDQDRVRPGAWLPFGAGPHACPGRNLGLAQLTHLAEWARAMDHGPGRARSQVDQSRGIFPNPARLRFTAPPRLQVPVSMLPERRILLTWPPADRRRGRRPGCRMSPPTPRSRPKPRHWPPW